MASPHCRPNGHNTDRLAAEFVVDNRPLWVGYPFRWFCAALPRDGGQRCDV